MSFPERPDDIKAQLDAAIDEIEMSRRITEERTGQGAPYLDCVLTRLRSIKPVVDVSAAAYKAKCLDLHRVAQEFARVVESAAHIPTPPEIKETRVVYVWPRVPMEGQPWLYLYAIEGFCGTVLGPRSEAEAIAEVQKQHPHWVLDVRKCRPPVEFECMDAERQMKFWRTFRERPGEAA